MASARSTSTPPAPRRLAFMTDMGLRGTSVAEYDYADAADSSIVGFTQPPLLLYKRFFVFSATLKRLEPVAFDEGVLAKHVARFGAENVKPWPPPERNASAHNTTLLHMTLLEHNVTDYYELAHSCTPRNLPGIRTYVHAVFEARRCYRQPKGGTIYARIGMTVRDNNLNVSVVPHIVREPSTSSSDGWSLDGPNLRAALKIPSNATVFCRHGGSNSFNRATAVNTVKIAAKLYGHLYFLFANTRRFMSSSELASVPNVIHLEEPLVSATSKATFIRTCDAMLHGRNAGESFGLAIAEMSVLNKPIFTSPAKDKGGDDFHLHALGDKAYVYTNSSELLRMMLSFNRTHAAEQGPRYWNAYDAFRPRAVMLSFACVFFAGRTCQLSGPPPPEVDEVPPRPLLDFGAAGWEDEACSRCSQFTYFSYQRPRALYSRS